MFFKPTAFTRTALKISTAMALATGASANVQAQLVTGGDLVGSQDAAGNPGQLNISNPNANTANIDVLAQTVIAEWTDFNVPSNTTLNVTNGSPAAKAALLNRIIGGSPSDLGGTINSANVDLWFINRNGILFGADTTINASSFVASTLNLANGEFFDYFEGTNNFGNGSSQLVFTGASTAPVSFSSQANITTEGNLWVFGSADFNPNGNYNSTNGTIGLARGSRVIVNQRAGSPLSIFAESSATPGDMTVSGNLSGTNILIARGDPSGIHSNLLTIDANLTATAATETEGGISLFYSQSDSRASPGLIVNGNIDTSGLFRTDVRGDTTLNVDIEAGSIRLFAANGDIVARNLVTTSGNLRINGERTSPTSLTAESLTSAASITLDVGGASLGNLSSNYEIDAIFERTATVSGTVDAVNDATLRARFGDLIVSGDITAGTVIITNDSGVNDLTLQNVTAKVGLAVIFSDGNINVGDVTGATAAILRGRSGLRAGNVTATAGRIELESERGLIKAGNVSATGGSVRIGASFDSGGIDVGSVSGTGSVSIENDGDIAVGDVLAPSSLRIYGQAAITTGDLTTSVLRLDAYGTVPVLLTGNNAIDEIGNIFGTAPEIAVHSTNDLAVGLLIGLSGANITLTTDGDLTLNAPFDPANPSRLRGGTIALSAGSNFINNFGADAFDVDNYWVIYSNSPSGNVFGDLDSATTAIWGETLDKLAPGTVGINRYVFAERPELTITTTTDATKIYGTDVTGDFASDFIITGIRSGVSNAFVGDTAADVFTGSPVVSSNGEAANADVNGSPYIVSASQGSLTLLNGYQLVFADNGRLTISPKAISGSVTANDKTYNATTDATGTVTLSGVIAGDTVGTSGTVFTFGDKNVGTDKTVSVSGTTLTGGDAGNYTLTVPASALADIFAKAISGTASANDKTYNATTDATGTVTLSGVIAGDTVGTSGTIFTFGNKNAGADKTVFVTGTALTGTDAGNYSLSVPSSVLADILAKAIGATVTADDKTYDATTGATGSLSLDGVIAGDAVSTAGTRFSFENKNAGDSKVVNVSGTTLTGSDAGNYVLTLPASALADIFAKAISGTADANDKTYDGTTTGSGSVTLSGIFAGDTVGTRGTVFDFADKNAGADKTVRVSGTSLTGADAGNYTLTAPLSTLADIFAKEISGALNAEDKIYDGSVAADGSISLNGVIAGDAVNVTGANFAFSDKNAGTDKTVRVSGAALAGADAGNYSLNLPTSALASIFAKAISADVSATDKTYDGTTAATGSVGLIGVIAGDDVTANGATFSFVDKNAGAGKTVSVSGATLTGNDAGNYTLTVPASAVASIFAKAISATVVANDKTYDGSNAGTGSVALTGVISGDTVGTSGSVFTFADKNAGTDKVVTVTGTGLTGADAGNYVLTVAGSTLADILQRALLLTADDLTKLEGEADPEFTYSVDGDGLVSGDEISGALEREIGEALGEYQISQGSIDAGSNYTIEFSAGVLTIAPVAIVSEANASLDNTLRAVTLPTALNAPLQSNLGLVVEKDAMCDADDNQCVAAQ